MWVLCSIELLNFLMNFFIAIRFYILLEQCRNRYLVSLNDNQDLAERLCQPHSHSIGLLYNKIIPLDCKRLENAFVGNHILADRTGT